MGTHIINVPSTHRHVIGRFRPILNGMTIHNFKWLLHVILFMHTQRVIQKQKDKEKMEEHEDEESIDLDLDDL